MKYRSGAVCWQDEILSDKPIKGKYFSFQFEEPLSQGFRQNDLELIIKSSNELNAQKAYELFIAGLTLIDGHTVYEINDLPTVKPYDKPTEKYTADWFYRKEVSFSRTGIYEAARIVAKASFRKMYTYALLKYLFACSQHSNYLIHLDPFHTDYERLSRNPSDHLRYSYSILAFYSILEELNLEIRASQKKLSKINGNWNPVVREDLENRLTKSKIDLNKKANWNLRSRPTKVQLKDKLKLLGKSSWSKYSIRDSEIEIIDAIAYISWLRSKIIAHKLSDSFLSISIYDVANANFLVRRILMDILGIDS
ncbi:hypothetical protein [Flagellimonas sp. 2504JD1-5]